ncbi:MAG: DUF3090 family protein [Actinomycetota bacterium]|jgi:uncharacterized repeat protein (TIGR03847 family)
MSSSFELHEVELITTGAIGPPGQRVFYLQVRHPGGVVSLRLEKAQVAALCRYLDEMLEDLPAVEAVPADMDLAEPVVAEWVVGSLGVTYDEEDERFLLVAEEMVDEDEPPARALIRATTAQMAAFTRHGSTVVASGRPPCPLCGGPLDPDGHMCVRLNGHRDLGGR